MYLNEMQAAADNEIVERFKGGFVARLMRNCHCVTGPYSRIIWRQVATRDVTKLFIEFSDHHQKPGEHERLATLAIRWPFDFAFFITSDEASAVHREPHRSMTAVGASSSGFRHVSLICRVFTSPCACRQR